MKKTMLLLSLLWTVTVQAQSIANIGAAFGGGYMHFRNPATQSPQYKSGTGGVGVHLGPVLTLGKPNLRITFSPYVLWASSLKIGEYKGLGTFGYGGLVKVALTNRLLEGTETVTINNTSQSANTKGQQGFSIGAGWQSQRTDLLAVPDKYMDLKREYYNVYYGMAGYTFVAKTFVFDTYLKLGFGIEKSHIYEIGLCAEVPVLRLHKKPKLSKAEAAEEDSQDEEESDKDANQQEQKK